MKLQFYRLLITLIACIAAITSATATAENVDQDTPLKIGVKEAPPFVIKNDSGEYTGISIELWQSIANELNLNYQYVETDLNGLIDGLTNGQLDASVAALTVTSAREAVIDFSHPYHSTGLAIATSNQGNPVLNTLKRLFSVEFLASLAALAGVLMLVGILLWIVERKKNQAMFGGTAPEGIGASFWWAAVTMTTVGYGDKAPITFWGRIIALVWMFAAIIIISSFTAAIATSLTVGHLETNVKDVNDLYRVKVATLSPSASGNWLDQQRIHFSTESSIQDAISKLQKNEYDAVVYDKPILQYVISQNPEFNTPILPHTFLRQDYAIAMVENSQLRESINQALLKIITTEEWQQVLANHLGNI